MTPSPADTIFALASAKGRAGVAVVRLSGPDAGSALEDLTGRVLPPARKAVFRTLSDPRSGEILDRGLVLWFPGPASFTGEDVAELHLHGGPAVVEGVSSALLSRGGVRLAEPGEFSRRAFENGKLDLTQAEGLADLVAAETEAQKKQALRQLDGALGAIYEGWRAGLVRALAHLEAELDFPDEDQVPDDLFAATLPVLDKLSAEMQAHLADSDRGRAIRTGFEVVIVGAPNVGKSSLINALAKRDVAIVSETPGTTRDTIEVRLDLGGYAVTLVDTAGLREGSDVEIDAIEREGMRRTLARRGAADLTIEMLVAGDNYVPGTAGSEGGAEILVLNKTDLLTGADREAALQRASTFSGPICPISVQSGDGLGRLLDVIEAEIVARMGLMETPSLTRSRHRQAVVRAAEALDRAAQAAHQHREPELVAEDVRLAARALGQITGRVDVEDILDVVFSEFCIGK